MHSIITATMGITLYGSEVLTCTQKVLLVLFELGEQFELSNVEMRKGEHRASRGSHGGGDLNQTNVEQDPAFVKDHHPFRLIPVLYDNDVKIFESRAICSYMVEKHRGSQSKQLVTSPIKSLAGFAADEQALSIEYSYFDPAMKTLSYELIFKKWVLV
jgi:glutathione S-transferase